MIDISIIIPHYNSVVSLEKLLNSIPKNKALEIIVIDDNSTDHNALSFNRLKNTKRYSHVLFKQNTTNYKGAGTCRNIGISFAKGKWIVFADADDFFTDDFYNIVSNYLESDNDVVFFTPRSIDINTQSESDRHVPYEQLIDEYLLDNNIIT